MKIRKLSNEEAKVALFNGDVVGCLNTGEEHRVSDVEFVVLNQIAFDRAFVLLNNEANFFFIREDDREERDESEAERKVRDVERDNGIEI